MAIGGIIGGILGNIFGSDDRDKSLEQQQAALKAWLDVNVPDPEKQKVWLEKYVSQGELSPEMASAVLQGDTELNKISTAPNPAQIRALAALEREGLAGGLSLQDEATLQEQVNNTNAAARGRNDSIVQDYAQRGMGGSGLELQARMMNTQNATHNAGNTSLSAAAAARDRALKAIMGAGELGGQIQQQEYGQKANKAKAQDIIKQYNASNLQRTGEMNTRALNDAQRYNLDSKQAIANANVDMGNKEQIYNKNVYQQAFDNNARKAQGLQQPYGNLANTYNNNANATAEMWAGIGKGVDQGLGAATGAIAGVPGGASAAGGVPYDDYLKSRKKLDEWSY